MERAKSFSDRLAPIIPREEEDISHLDDAMASLLYPGRRPAPFRIGVGFAPFEGEAGEQAVALAQRSAVYRKARRGRSDWHEAAFDSGEASTLHALVALVGSRAGTEVTVDGRRVPYGHELWLPLFWLFRREDAD